MLPSYFPGGTLNALASLVKGSTLPPASVQRLQPGIPGYLIPFSPRAFVNQRQGSPQSAAFAFGVPYDINGFHPYTVRSADL